MNPEQNIQNPISVSQPGEVTLFEIRRHPVGIIGVYFTAGVLLFVLAMVLFILVPNYASDFSGSQIMSIASISYIIFAFLTIGFLFVANKVYWGNRWVLTSDSVTQITQTSLFNSQSSQLSLGNLEDITVEQKGIFAHMFNYGVLRVQTAGEHSRFQFIYCPRPNYYAQQVIAARERFEQHLRDSDQPIAPMPPAQTPPFQPPVNNQT